MKISREEGVAVLEAVKKQLDETVGKEDTIKLLAYAGSTVGYAPAFRALVMDKPAAQAIRWT